MRRARPVEATVISTALLDGLRDRIAAWPIAPVHASLFGSAARRDGDERSDIDVLVVLETLTGDYGEELERGLAAVYPVALRLGRRVSVKPLAREEYERGDSPLLREVRRSGVAA